MAVATWPTLSIAEWLLLGPVVFGSFYVVACVAALAWLLGRARKPAEPAAWPAVTLLKPICGLEKGLEENLRSACRQEYPDFHVVFSVQRRDDPALPLLERMREQFGPDRVDVVVDETQTAPNGKIANMQGAISAARHEVLVISDSDVRLPSDYLKSIVAPLGEPGVGCVCTFYRAVGAEAWYERLEQLTYNADFVPALVFARVSGASQFVLGASTALTRSTLGAIGGLAQLGDYLVEDFEMGRRILASGRRVVIVPRFVDTIVDLRTPRQWWDHQVYWDQNTRAAKPGGLFATILVRSVPFALLFALARLFDPLGLAVLGAALAVRLATAGAFLLILGDRLGARSLALLPLRDLGGLVSWLLAFLQPTVVWRGGRFTLTRDGRMVPIGSPR